MIRRHELPEAKREFIQPLLPVPSRSRKRRDDRTIPNGTVWKFRTKVAWPDLPERYGPWTTPHTRFRRWARNGTFTRTLQAAQARADATGTPTGRCRSTPRPCTPTTTPPEPEKEASGTGTVTRRPDQQDSPGLRRSSRGGRPPAFDQQLHKRRNAVKRCFNQLKQWHGIPPATTRRPSPTRHRHPRIPADAGVTFDDGP
ncbi:transposase [Streptomyces thermoalcalitolerans]|uniref:transposase n=1 Tax=Streptomyces thermoalcalitolerans TaxID=65605 RepID=UPI003CD076FB